MVLVPRIPENTPKQPEDANYTVRDRRGHPLHAESKFLGEWINGMEAKILDGEAPPPDGWWGESPINLTDDSSIMEIFSSPIEFQEYGSIWPDTSLAYRPVAVVTLEILPLDFK